MSSADTNQCKAYISVITGSTSVTATVSKTSLAALSHELTVLKVTVKVTGLDGRFHTPAHNRAYEKIRKFCASNPDLQFPPAASLFIPIRSVTNADTMTNGVLHEIALDSILTKVANWHLTLSAATSLLVQTRSPSAVQIGLLDCIPASIVRDLDLTVIRIGLSKPTATISSKVDFIPDSGITPGPQMFPGHYPDHAVAIIGMACKFPGADSLEEFWQVINKGKSMLAQIPDGRFPVHGLRRSPGNKLPFWGNFVSDIDAFDHRFFKKSPREASSMDPQQRLLLQVAYETLESSGYFGEFSKSQRRDFGCYLGVCASDYNDNVASHPPNAFSSLGTLRAFLSGKISHFFGWTGPSITYDTACSSSAVAIHSACKALQLGECSSALAGGASLFTSPNFYQNLAAASFLSPTGATKPFDSKADGYCRGEGIGLVMLKKLSDAIRDKDTVMGVILGSAVNQNMNSCAITVPHSLSQTTLYENVSSLAGINTSQVSFVEAHGTGTSVGDPIEIESIRRAFGGPHRSDPLNVASVKGNIGHLEGASGVAGLIKTVLMMNQKIIPVQANFSTLSHKIPPLEQDKMIIPRSSKKWDADLRIACVNNYGAAGSNAAIILCEPPLNTTLNNQSLGLPDAVLSKYPIFISANSPDSLSSYCTTLERFFEQSSLMGPSAKSLRSMAFNLAEKQNRSMPYTLITVASDVAALKNVLAAAATGSSELCLQLTAKTKPVVLMFGGQEGNTVGLRRDVYDNCSLLNSHLDQCDAILLAAGLKGLYPHIFDNGPANDIVNLHCMIFSLQYSCAKSWIDSGLEVEAMVGYSFGQLTALAVSGSLSLEHSLRLISGRATLMQKHWGPERGSMISLEADLDTVLSIISTVKQISADDTVEVACFNGDISHVVVGTEASINEIENLIADQSHTTLKIRYKKLNVTNGFHSKFTEPLLPGLLDLAKGLVFNEPTIPIETCSVENWTRAKPSLIVEHTRTPVYFGKAVQRLEHRLGSCTWLEAGSSSSVTGMVRRALQSSPDSSHFFQAIQLNRQDSMDFLSSATANLWREGHRVQFWPFHRSQKHTYSPIHLPPYQFEKSRHWLKWEDNVQTLPVPEPVKEIEMEEPVLISFAKFLDHAQRDAEFYVDPRSEQYKLYVRGHAVLAEPLCPAPLYFELVSHAAADLGSKLGSAAFIPCIEGLEIKTPLGLNDCIISILMTRIEGSVLGWTFTVASKPRGLGLEKGKKPQQHATGRVSLHSDNPVLCADFARYERMIDRRRLQELTSDSEAEALQGSQIYKAFAKVVQYAEYYKGVKAIFSKERKVVAQIKLPAHNFSALQNTVCDPLAIDNFIQVAGLHVNILNECGDNEVFVCTEVDRIQPSPRFKEVKVDAESWLVYSDFHPTSDKKVFNDIFVFDPTSKSLAWTILGARFTKVLVTSLAKVLSRANGNKATTNNTNFVTEKSLRLSVDRVSDLDAKTLPSTADFASKITIVSKPQSKPWIDMKTKLMELLAKITDIRANMIQVSSTLEDLGIDSLMATEVLGEIRTAFNLDIPVDDFSNFRDVQSLLNYLTSKGGAGRQMTLPPALEPSSFSSTPNDFEIATPNSLERRATSVSNEEFSEESHLSRLANLVASHLETTATLTQETNLGNQGLDSLLSIELASDIKEMFAVDVNMSHLDGESTFGDLAKIVLSQVSSLEPSISTGNYDTADPALTTTVQISSSISKSSTTPSRQNAVLINAQRNFDQIRLSYDQYTEQTGFAHFWEKVYPTQARLVLAYVVEAFEKLGCSIASLGPSEHLPPIQYMPKHALLMSQLRNILRDAELVYSDGNNMVRSAKTIDHTPALDIHQAILNDFPQHLSEHKLLHVTGSRLADCLTGVADPLQLLFRSKENKEVLEDVYANGPMYKAITKLLGSFLSRAYANPPDGGIFNILELGGGTGGTTKYIVDFLKREGIQFTYTFTDISGSLVAAVRKKFIGHSFMDFMVLDIEKSPSENMLNRYHTIISTNCIHATRNLSKSMINIRQMLRLDGFVSLVEFTRNMYWFDLVFGLLEGWWLFEDGREHVLADEWFWDSSMRAAGFKHVTWTDGVSEEARTLRIIAGFPVEPESGICRPAKSLQHKSQNPIDTVVYKQVGKLSLNADIYYPSDHTPSKRPVGTASLE